MSATLSSCWEKTSPAICTSDSTMSAATFKAWVAALRLYCSPRRMSVRANAVNACGCSPTEWATATAHPRTHSARQVDHGEQLANQAQNWPTPEAQSGERAGKFLRKEAVEQGTRHAMGLHHVAENWHTPRAAADKAGLPRTNDRDDLQAQAMFWQNTTKMWETPTAGSLAPEASYNRPGQTQLGVQARVWATPRASENENRQTAKQPSVAEGHGEALAAQACEMSEKHTVSAKPTPCAQAAKGKGGHSGLSGRDGGMNIQTAAETWPTPTAESYGTNQGGAMGRIGPMRPSLDTMARSGLCPGLPDPPTEPHGSASSPNAPISLRLSPRFVEWLMGFPMGWTSPWPTATTGFGAWATLSFLCKDLSLSWHSGKNSTELDSQPFLPLS